MSRFMLAPLLLAFASAAVAADASAPLATVQAFQKALQHADVATANTLLAPDVLIYEAGGEETSRAEYAAAHMKGDMEFMADATAETLGQRLLTEGKLAVVSSRTRIRGVNHGKPLDLFSTETMVLKLTPEGWRIAHIHWSAQPAVKTP